jgi:hypothetical protein
VEALSRSLNLKFTTLLGHPPNSAKSFEAKYLEPTSNWDIIVVVPRIMKLINVSSMVVEEFISSDIPQYGICLTPGKEVKSHSKI